MVNVQLRIIHFCLTAIYLMNTKKKTPLESALLINQTEGTVNLQLVIDIAKQGVPDSDPVLRFYLWQILLNIIPCDRSKWDSAVQQHIQQYQSWENHYFSNVPDWLTTDISDDSEIRVKHFGLDSDTIMATIHGDLSRTPSDSFVQLGLCTEDNNVIPFVRRIERILYIFSSLNATYSYTQGFNELSVTIFHVVHAASKQVGIDLDTVESISFFMLQNLITGTGLGDLFTMAEDFDSVASQFSTIPKMTKIADKELYDFLFVKLKINPLQFAFSWVSLLFSQIYDIEPLLTLWDRFLVKESNILDFAMAMATAHLIEEKSNIISKNYIELMDYLQELHNLDHSKIISRSEDVWSQYIAATT